MSGGSVVIEVAGIMKEKLGSMDLKSLSKAHHTIFRVPHDVQREDTTKGSYDPEFISIGPYHHGEDILRPMEAVKWAYLQDLLERSTETILDNYVESVLACEEEARGKYSEKLDFDSRAFVEMLVLDGCFLVELFLKRAIGRIEKPMTAQKRNLPMLRHDLLLLENQIPFFVLQAIFDNTVVPIRNNGATPLTLMDFALHYISRGKVKKETLPDNVYHLLHLYHLCLLQGFKSNNSPQTEPCAESLSSHLFRKIKKLMYWIFHTMLSLLRKMRDLIPLLFFGFLYIVVLLFQLLIMCKRPRFCTFKKKKTSKHPRMIPTATELHEAGVSFKKKAASCYLDVSFKSGRMEMPCLSIQENSNSEFRNLLAFEQSFPDVGNKFTSYVVLMDNIVDTANDVAILKRHGIVESKLGCDEDVAQFFNKLRHGTYLDYDKHYLNDLFTKVNKYCETDHHRWLARLKRDYFSNPWAIISLVAASYLLLLTTAQTVYAILSYHHPKK